MSRNGAVLCFWWPFADHDLGAHELLPSPSCPGPRYTKSSTGTQTSNQFTAQRAAALDVECLIDGLMRNPQRLILWIVDQQPIRDLLGAPRSSPPSVLSTTVAAPRPIGSRAWYGGSVRRGDCPRQAILHVSPQHLVHCKLGTLRALGSPVGVPLSGRRPILQIT